MSFDDAAYLTEERRRDPVFYSTIIREKLGPLIGYAEGRDDARLLLELGVNYLKITERDEQGKVKNFECLNISKSKSKFVRAYFFVSLMNELYEHGDVVVDDVADDDTAKNISRDEIKKTVSSTLMKQFKIDMSGKSLNHISKSVIERYDVFRKRKNTRKKLNSDKGLYEDVESRDLDSITLGYKLKTNVHIEINDKSI